MNSISNAIKTIEKFNNFIENFSDNKKTLTISEPDKSTDMDKDVNCNNGHKCTSEDNCKCKCNYGWDGEFCNIRLEKKEIEILWQ